MNSQVIYRLAGITQLLREDLPLSASAIDSLLKQCRHPPVLQTILQLLCIIRESLINRSPQRSKAESVKLLQEVLVSLGPLLEVNAPLKYLITRQHQAFAESCKDSSHPALSDLNLRSHGLYPPHSPTGFNSIFSKYSQEQPFQGNPHWILTRYGLSHWYILHKDQLPSNIRQCYSFLLSQRGLANEFSGLHRLWALLYCYYTQLVLEQELIQSEDKEERFITWRVSTVGQYRKQIQAQQDQVPSQFKSVYYLTLEALFFLFPESGDDSRFLIDAFKYFNKLSSKSSELGVLASTLFLKITQIRQLDALGSQIRQSVRTVFERKELKGFDFFRPIYFNFQQILTSLTEGLVRHQELNLNSKEKNAMASFMLRTNRIQDSMLNYLSTSQIQWIFQTKQWQEIFFASHMLPILQKHRSYLLNKLQLILGTAVEERIIQQHFDLFTQVWTAYQKIQQQSSPEIQLLSTVTSIDKKMLRGCFHFMVLPRECSKAVLNILLGYARFFGKSKAQMRAGGPALKHFRQFQQEELPGLLSPLDENERNEFWKEWGELLRCDPDFVEDILHPHEPSTQV